jgi:hypothetical protein
VAVFVPLQIQWRTITETEYKAGQEEKISPLLKPEIKLWKFLFGRKKISFALKVFCVLNDRLCGLVARVPGYRMEMCCDSCEVRTEFMYVM